MNGHVVEETVTCPVCWEPITLAIDTSVPQQEYVEDCSVCCRPLVIRCTAVEGAVVDLEVEAESA